MDATPTRIKERAVGKSARRVEVLRPETFDELVELVTDLGRSGRGYTVVGARSNVVGALATDATVALSTERLVGVASYDEVSQLVTAGAGTVGGELEEWLASRDRTLGQLPQSLYLSTIGGWVATRATGSLSTRYGGVEYAIRGARIVAPTGSVYAFGPRVRAPGGLDALAAFVGSEGSLGVVGEVTLEVHRLLPERLACFLLSDIDAVINVQRELVQGGYPVALLRGYNEPETAHLLEEDEGTGCLLMVTTIGPASLVDAQDEAITRAVTELGGRRFDDAPAMRWYAERYRVDSMMEERNAEHGVAFDTIEVSVPWAAAAACVREMELALASIADRHYLHFSHAYETGVCFYNLVWLSDAAGDEAVLDRLSTVWQHALSIVDRHGGAVGHHHGIGGIRAKWYQRSDDARVHGALKKAWDPRGLLHARLLSSE